MKKKTATEIGRRDFLRVVAITAGGGIVAACAPVAVQPSAPPAAQATEVPAAAPTTAPATGPKVGGTLTLGSGQAAQQLDPHVSTFAYERLYYVGLYNGLTEFNPDMELIPSLAESWEASDDLLTYTFKLRPGVKFHNGREMTAEDIKWNYERVLDPALGSQIRNNVQEIEKIEILDPLTIRFTLSSPSVTLPIGAQELRIIAPESLENINKAPIGTGPFMYEDFVPDEHLYLKRFDDYWGQKAYLDRVQLVGIKDATAAFTALTTGAWDAMWNLSTKDASQLSSSPSAVPLVPKVQSSNVFWELDTTSPPFDKVEARQALSYAVDRQSIADVAYFGFAQPYFTNNPVPPDNWAFTSGLIDYQYDLAKAKELFAKAGVTEGTELVFWTIASQFPEWVTSAEILQQSLAEIGITLKIEQNEIGTWVDKFYPSGKKYPGLIIPNGDTSLLDPAFRLKFFSVDRCECNFNDPKIDELLAQGKSTADRAKRKEAYDQIQRIVNEQVPVLIPSSWPFLNANQNFVKDIWAESGGFIHYESAWLDK
ncbi:MAG: hypothetical protein IT331_22425 [Anaerolineae bacterium]|nr:hypothetical protein [Anaerolineae bacterium]